MSQENVEIVRRFYERWNAGDVDAVVTLYNARAVIYAPDGWPEPGPFRGRDEIAAEVRRTVEGFHELTIVIEAIAAHEDWVLTRHHTRLRGDRSGLEGELRHSVAFRLREGTIIEARIYWDHDDALKAAGLEE